MRATATDAAAKHCSLTPSTLNIRTSLLPLFLPYPAGAAVLVAGGRGRYAVWRWNPDPKQKTSMASQHKTLETLKAYPVHAYEGINLNWLVLVAVGAVEECGIGLSFEHVVVTSFKLFPKKFSLLGYPEHPDAKRVHDALWRCAYENRQWLIGKTSQGFAFTQRGRQELEIARKAT